jgi:hypothetical protein
MVNLSLGHRAKLERQATLLSESMNDGPRKAMFGVSAVLVVLNFAFLVMGTFIAARIDYGWYGKPGGPPEKMHKEGTIVVDRA